MKTKVLKLLEVATVQDDTVKSGDGKKVSNERTQSSGWLWDQVETLKILFKGKIVKKYVMF